MSRTLRLFACAAGMLALAVLACLILQDGETVKSGGQEVSGKILGSAESRSRAEVSEPEAARREERAGVARVKVLELAKAAAENKARAEAAPEEKPEAVPAEAPKAEAAKSEAARNEAVEAEALALIRGEMPAPEVRPLPAEKPAEARPEAPSGEKAEKAEPVKAEVKKAEAKKAPEKKAEEKRNDKLAEEKAEGKEKLHKNDDLWFTADSKEGLLAAIREALGIETPKKAEEPELAVGATVEAVAEVAE